MTLYVLIWLFFGACAAILNTAIVWAMDDQHNGPRTKVLSGDIMGVGIASLFLGVFSAMGILMSVVINKMIWGKNWPHSVSKNSPFLS